MKQTIDQIGGRSKSPTQLRFHFPAEFERHEATLLIWPERPGSWGRDPRKAEVSFAEMIRAILLSEDVHLLVSKKAAERVADYFEISEKQLLAEGLAETGFTGHTLHVHILETDDSWARDTGPTWLVSEDRKERLAVNWSFNAWGGTYDGLYASCEKDELVAKCVAGLLGDAVRDAAPFVLEGGSIHTDGEGTLLVTEACLLSKGRNPDLSKEEIEEKLKQVLGVEKILWLPRGIYNDETNEHVDNVATFLRPGEVVLAWTEDETDPQYPLSVMDYEYLSGVTDAKGRKLRIHKLPIPRVPVCYTEEEVSEYDFEPGEDIREPGERLAASYVNFYFTNRSILIPGFGGENEESDRLAAKFLGELCPERDVIPIPARPFILGGGNIHCLTQQIPEVKPE